MFVDIGAMIVKGLFNGIKNAPGALWSAAKGLAHSFAGGFKEGAGIHSPSRVFHQLGGYLMAGLHNGIDDNAGSPLQRMSGLSRQLAAALAVGAAIPAVATSPGAGGLHRGSAGTVAAAGPAPIEIHIHQAPGQSAVDLARAVSAELDRREKRKAAAKHSSFADTPDWDD